MQPSFTIYPFDPPGDAAALRAELRGFLAQHKAKLGVPNCWVVGDPGFSRALGAAGFLGMTLPKAVGGHERHPLERYVVIEELLAAGAPVGAHWIADRQTAPLILRYGSEEAKAAYLPGMCAGELYACIGLSEPGAGSDLAAVRSTARLTDEGWRISGQKIWTSGAHLSHVMLALVRSEEGSERNTGLSQLLIPMDAPGVTIRPIIDMAGEHHFNEVFFDDVLLPEWALVGTRGQGWAQATAELALERSGPERYLSSHVLMTALIDAAGPDPEPQLRGLIGELIAELWTLRQMSMSTAAKLAAGEDPMVEASMVKDLGNSFEQALPQRVQALVDCPSTRADDLARLTRSLLISAPSFSLRGGTREIIRGIIARGLGLR
jgi:Acyl-CoA dehydrogenase, middle domain/Acyl-CoA dehydrogenase, N-terminal domain